MTGESTPPASQAQGSTNELGMMQRNPAAQTTQQWPGGNPQAAMQSLRPVQPNVGSSANPLLPNRLAR